VLLLPLLRPHSNQRLYLADDLDPLEVTDIAAGKLILENPQLGIIPVFELPLDRLEGQVVLGTESVAVVAVNQRAVPGNQGISAAIFQQRLFKHLAVALGQCRQQIRKLRVDLDSHISPSRST